MTKKEVAMVQEKGKDLYPRVSSTCLKGVAIILVILSHFAEWWFWFSAVEGSTQIILKGLSCLGPYGVAIFLLFSGYGITKSAGEQRIGIKFVGKRVVNVYLPYVITAGLIDVLSGGLKEIEDLWKLLYGHDFWYMMVLFVFYAAFIGIWFLFENRHCRAVLMLLVTCGYSYYLYFIGQHSFWYISNIAFAVGVLCALYESFVKRIVDRIGGLCAIVSGCAAGIAMWRMLFMHPLWDSKAAEIRNSEIAVVSFIIFIVFFAAVFPWKKSLLCVLGKNSLYLYLLHTYIFMWTINFFKFQMWINFLLAAVLITAVSITVGSGIHLCLRPILTWLNKKE